MVDTERGLTLKEARNLWSEIILDKGAKCPCCDRWGRAYRRRINLSMCKSLSWLAAQKLIDGWVDVPNRAPKWLLRTNQLASLRWWDLVERRLLVKDSKKKHSGEWRVTDKGREFLEGSKIPDAVLTYAGEVLSTSEELTTLKEVHNRFDYHEIMST